MARRPSKPKLAAELAAIGRRFYDRGWVMGTSGNFSAVLSAQPLRLAITASSRPQGHARSGADSRSRRARAGCGPGTANLRPRRCCTSKSSRARGAGAVLHTHSVWSTMLSDLHATAGGLAIAGYEMLKGPRRRLDARAPGVDADRAERSGHAAAGARGPRTLLDRRTGRARVPAAPSRALHVGPRRCATRSGTSRFSSFCSRRSDRRLESSHGRRENP